MPDSEKILWALALLVTALFGILFGRQGVAKGYPFILGFALPFLGSPFLAWLVILWLPDRMPESQVRPEFKLAVELELAKLEAERRASAPNS